MHPVAVWTIKATELDAVQQRGNPGFNKAVPPQLAAATGTSCRLLPGIGRAETGNFLDGYGDKQYQLLNSFQERLFLTGGGIGPLQRPCPLPMLVIEEDYFSGSK
jgi:hypothetical protein